MLKVMAAVAMVLVAASVSARVPNIEPGEKEVKLFSTLRGLQTADGPIRIEPSSAFYRFDHAHSAALVISLRATNVGVERVRDFVVELNVYGSDGQRKGMHGFSVGEGIAPGETMTIVRRINTIAIDREDIVYFVPVRSVGQRTEWKIDTGSLHAALAELETTRTTGRTPVTTAAALTEITGAFSRTTANALNCETKCINAEERCGSTCTCGVKSFSCSCTEGGSFSYTCTCFICPT